VRKIDRVERAARSLVESLECRRLMSTTFLAVAAGDATSNDAILWTRAQDSASTAGVPLTALVSTDPNFGAGVFYTGTTDPAHDYTIHLDATGLQSGTQYYYRFVAGDGTSSPIGTFKTAPAPNANVDVHFGFTGDADGLMRPYPAADGVTAPGGSTIADQHFNYFVWLGDTIYETASGTAGNNLSPVTPSTSTASNLTPAGLTAMQAAYWAKYKQQFIPVSTGSDPGLTSFFSSDGHYTLLDNHELGNKQVINGGAPTGTNPVGIGVDASNPANDVNTTGTFMNQTPVFKTLQGAYTDYQPIRVQTVNAPNDPRSNGTQQMYFSQQWGAHDIFFNLDDRSYRDIRLKTAAGADDTGVRADNAARTMLGQTQLNWFEQGLLAAQADGTTWKFVADSSPIDQIGAIGSGADGGKSWMGGYRAERNELLQFIADNHIDHVIFLSTDDHQVRINELGYFTQFDANGTPIQSSYTRVPGTFEIVCGPIGATGPDAITDHSFSNIQNLAQTLASQEIAAGVDPIGLDPNFPGLKNVTREGDPNASTSPSPFDFYSPDTFNYASLDVSPDGSTLTVTLDGINSYAVNTFPQPSASNPIRQILSFQIGLAQSQLAVQPASAIFGDATTSLSAKLSNALTAAAIGNQPVTFTLNGNPVGTATTNASGVATLSNVSLAGLTPGNYTVTASFAGDAGDLPSTGTGTLHLAYDVKLGFDNTKPKKSGSTLPITLSLLNAAGVNLSSASIALHAVGIAPIGQPNQIMPPQSPGNSQPGGLFDFDNGNGGEYQFNLKTSGLDAGTYLFYYTVGNDPTLYSLQFSVK
jgi:phosphodiesterase/alkaline phosphatase D-like protein